VLGNAGEEWSALGVSASRGLVARRGIKDAEVITVRLVQDERGGFGWPADLQPPRRQTSSWRALRNRAVNTPSAYPPPAKADVLSSRQLFSRYQAQIGRASCRQHCYDSADGA